MPRFTVHDSYIVWHAWDGDVEVDLRDGQLPVGVRDQGYNPWDRGEQLISLDAAVDPSPRWGQGWVVTGRDGTERWFASNWDSSG